MKKVILFMLLLTLVACTSTKRRERYIKENATTTSVMQESILSGRIAKGMSKKETQAAWGNPNSVNTTHHQTGKRTQWVYRYSSATCYVYFSNGLLTSWQKNIRRN